MIARLLLALGALCVLAVAPLISKSTTGENTIPPCTTITRTRPRSQSWTSLGAIVKAADANTALVPPGIYAEYGYLKLQQGNNALAIDLFKQEEARWPEGKVFMDRMIKVASMPSPASKGGSP